MTEYYSQIDPQFSDLMLAPGVSFASFGCLTSALCNLLQINPRQFLADNVGMWQADGNMKTDALCAKYGYKLVRQPVVEGAPLLHFDKPIICRTSWFAPKYPTHFFVVFPDGTLCDSARTIPKQSSNRYINRINEIRYLEKLDGSSSPVTPGTSGLQPTCNHSCPLHCSHT